MVNAHAPMLALATAFRFKYGELAALRGTDWHGQ